MKNKKTINALLAALAVICFLSMNYIDFMDKVQYSGGQMLKVLLKEGKSDDLASFIILLLYILIPIVQVIFTFICTEKLAKYSSLAMLLPTILAIFTFSSTGEGVPSNAVSFCAGFYTYLIISVLMIALAFIQKDITKFNSEQPQKNLED